MILLNLDMLKLVSLLIITASAMSTVLYFMVKIENPCSPCSCLQNVRPNASSKSNQKAAVLPQLPSTEFYIRMLSARSPPRADPFDAQINATELRAVIKLVWKFLDLCESHGIQAMLYGGTLLGSYRHHGIIPWDDDVDLLLKEADKAKLKKALDGDPGWRLTIENSTNSVWRVSRKSACFQKSAYGCWPFIDVCFYKLRDGLVIDVVGYSKYKNIYPQNYTLPVHKRPFMGRWVDSPRDSLNFLATYYGQTAVCSSLHLSHKFAKVFDSPEKISCKELASTYPFVLRAPRCAFWGGGVLETLRYRNGESLYTVHVKEPMLAVNDEYSIKPKRICSDDFECRTCCSQLLNSNKMSK